MQPAPATVNRVRPRPTFGVAERRRPRLRAAVVLSACRPRQWPKNLLVALAPAAAGALVHPAVAVEVAGVFAAFCLLSSATYLVNDVRDREQDRRHPRKRYRPVASGELAPRPALRLAAVIGGCGIALAVVVRPLLAAVAVGYVMLTTSYSLWWRHLVVADVLAVAAGFLLRAVGGATASGVGLSRSFLVVICSCALFVVLGKRYAELLATRSRAPSRSTLRRYSRRWLRLLLSITAAVGCVAYAWWAFARPGLAPWRQLSLAPFILWLVRYRRMLGAGVGEAPEELLLTDHALRALGSVWLALFVAAVYGQA